ncbi:unnamed protein product [Ilex paraguariensis]|uniref:non-specific serine/threonine protein kinase n=1 Tax=Ilex paraguariensis TaxID=185542 RepID=A0ABC8ST85_9AQUA
MQKDGNLVLYPRNVATNFPYKAYFATGTWDAANSSNTGYQLIFNEMGSMYVLKRSNERYFLHPTQPALPASDYYLRATLNFDGVFVLYSHRKNFSDESNWKALWSLPENICADVVGGEGNKGSGPCGYNSVCRLNEYQRPICECPQGYSLLDPNDKYGSCKPSFIQSCDEYKLGSPEDLYDFVEIIDTDWPTSDFEQFNPYSEEDCRNSCLKDCFCAVAIYRDNSCWMKKLPLSYGRKDTNLNSKAFVKFRKGDVPPQTRSPSPPVSEPKKKKNGALILVGSVLLGSSVFINFVLIGATCLGFFFIYHKKIAKIPQGNDVVGSNLRCFTYKELAEATNGFKQELGRGAFGIVYKGELPIGSTNIIAVKKLDRVTQDDYKEFKTEVNVIGQTHHKNLVRLLGFCDEGQHRLLVYEYLSNGTLAGYLFGDPKPSWDKRTQIALGIAKGLSYLHEECSTQIIHCDIKPQNILLDEYYNARISDFGLAKLLMINQSRTNTGIRGTKGYVAPEWFRNTPITVKVDVYSFGVLLMEIISCRRSLEGLEAGGDGGREILTDWVWDCFQEGTLEDLVQDDIEALDDVKKLEKFVMVGIWCIQEDPSLRPNMGKVSQMLEGVVEVTVPPCPYPFSITV